jgi:transcriptional regulator with XRE-family HTH domain
MTRSPKALINDLTPNSDGGIASPTSMSHQAKEAFARRLWRLMLNKGWNQAELGRRAGLSRDVIHSYVNAKSLPNQESLMGLARAFGVTAASLIVGDETLATPAAGAPAPTLHMSPTSDGKVFLQINMEIDQAKALKMIALLQDG